MADRDPTLIYCKAERPRSGIVRSAPALFLFSVLSACFSSASGDEHYGGPFPVSEASEQACQNLRMREALQMIGPRTLFNMFDSDNLIPSDLRLITDRINTTNNAQGDQIGAVCEWTYDIAETASNGLPGFPGGVARLRLMLSANDVRGGRELCTTSSLFRNRLASLEDYSAGAIDQYIQNPSLVPNASYPNLCLQFQPQEH